MEPKLAQKLMKNKEMNDFVAFLSGEVNKLNTIVDIDEKMLSPITQDIVVEIRARKLAFDKLIEILNPLLNGRVEEKEINKNEYQV